jgi:hypothetical protein
MKNNQPVKKYIRLYDGLKQERASWAEVWKELSAYEAPARGCFETDAPNRARRINHKILLDSSAGLAAEVLSAGMMSGLTSPSRSWFDLTVSPAEMAALPEVSGWLHAVKRRLEETLSKSNVYAALHGFYQEIAVFGTAALLIEENFAGGVHARLFTAGEYVLGTDGHGCINTFGREFFLTAKQMENTFGYHALPLTLQQETKQENTRYHKVFHLIFPNENYGRGNKGNNRFTYSSVYFLADGTLLRSGGYYEFPVIAARWEVKNDSDTYGRGPGWKCLGDVKMLQKMQKTKLVALDKNTNPPVMVSSNVQGEVNLLPGGITRYNGTTDAAVKPAYTVTPDLDALDRAIEQVRRMIKAHFFADVFTLLNTQDTPQMTAAEVAERREEKMTVLGPVLERLKNELLDPLVRRVFCILLRQGEILPAPAGVRGRNMQVEYISMIAQAQKAAGLSTLLQGAQLAAELSSADPSLGSRFNYRRVLEEGLEKLGLSHLLVVENPSK